MWQEFTNEADTNIDVKCPTIAYWKQVCTVYWGESVLMQKEEQFLGPHIVYWKEVLHAMIEWKTAVYWKALCWRLDKIILDG